MGSVSAVAHGLYLAWLQASPELYIKEYWRKVYGRYVRHSLRVGLVETDGQQVWLAEGI